MAVIIINPNSTAEMTAGMLAVARAMAPGTEFEGWTSEDGPPAIQGREDGARAVPPLLELVDKASRQGADAIVIGCFDDTGLDEANRIAGCPVIGIGQAAFHMAALRWQPYSVVTTLDVSVPIIDENIRAYGLARHLVSVRASHVPVLALEHDPQGAARSVTEEARRAVAEDGARVIILGCAGMARLTAEMRASLGVPVIDGVEAAARICPGLPR